MDPASFSHDFRFLIASASNIFCEMDNADWVQSRGEDRWTRLQILGHLIDSAINNHQRIVRALTQDSVEFPGYDQNAMVEAQQYGAGPSQLFIGLWESLNFALARIVSITPVAKLEVPIAVGGNAPVTLAFLIEDYVRHLQHHLRQIFESMDSSTVRWHPAVSD